MHQSRGIEVDGLVNARDLGGLRRQNGGSTPTGVFFRSENVDSISEAGWDQLHALGIRTVVDLRYDRERASDRGIRPNWLDIREVDLDGIENETFWKDYRHTGLHCTALYYRPHLEAMPERAGAALSAVLSAPPGGVLFHCKSGRDRTGLLAMLLLSAINTEPDDIVDDYLETVRLGEIRAIQAQEPNDEPEREELCREHGTTTEGAFRSALGSVELETVLARSGISTADRLALESWRGSIPARGSVTRVTHGSGQTHRR